MSVKITFLGAAGTVTGSKYLIQSKNYKILVDSGQFQGQRKWRERNWLLPDFDLSSVDAVLLTHAHIDHTGILPRYHSLGLNCPVYCTNATLELANLLLRDAGRLQEEDAIYRQRKKKSRHLPALPLFTEKDAISVLKLFQSKKFNQQYEILPGVFATWKRMGHILGAASIKLRVDNKTITFSGDIGRYDVPILINPQPQELGDLLLIESTYGNRTHDDDNVIENFAKIVNETYQRKGILIIPSFAVGRAQLLLYYLRELKEQNKIPNLPVIIDSPMATDATKIYRNNPSDYDEEALEILSKGKKPFTMSKLALIKEQSASRQLNRIDDPMIIISASGMLSGGRILHHLFHRISNPKNTVLFVGYQPPQSRGYYIKNKAKTINIFKEKVHVRAQIEELSGLSAHGDKNELLKWCNSCNGTPKKVAIVHGESDSATAFSNTLQDKLNWNTIIPKYLDEITI